MKSKHLLFLVCVILSFILSGCNEKIECIIVSPYADEVFPRNEHIEVVIKASTDKGFIRQVVLTVDDEIVKSFTTTPYELRIPAYTLPSGERILHAVAYSSGGYEASDVILFTIKE